MGHAPLRAEGHGWCYCKAIDYFWYVKWSLWLGEVPEDPLELLHQERQEGPLRNWRLSILTLIFWKVKEKKLPGMYFLTHKGARRSLRVFSMDWFIKMKSPLSNHFAFYKVITILVDMGKAVNAWVVFVVCWFGFFFFFFVVVVVGVGFFCLF